MVGLWLSLPGESPPTFLPHGTKSSDSGLWVALLALGTDFLEETSLLTTQHHLQVPALVHLHGELMGHHRRTQKLE